LAQVLSHPGWRSIEELMKMLPGATQPGMQQVKPKKKCEYAQQQCFLDTVKVFLVR